MKKELITISVIIIVGIIGYFIWKNKNKLLNIDFISRPGDPSYTGLTAL